MATILAIFVVVFLVIALSSGKQHREATDLKELDNTSPDAIRYNIRTGELFLNERSEHHKKRFYTERYISTRHGYTPEKLIFTSATVGGVTTGGWDKVGGNGTEKRKTDRFNLVYNYLEPEDNSVKTGYVSKIVLSDELLEKAKKSNVKPYLDGNNIVVVKPLERSEDDYLKLYMLSGCNYTNIIANSAENDIIRTLPDVIKVNYILNWICKNDPSDHVSE